MKVAFEDFTFDTAAQQLRRQGTPVPLPPKAMELLEILLERCGKLVTRGELMERIWPDVVVCDASLKNVVSILREALDDHRRAGRFIESVHRRGYRFAGMVIPLDESPELSLAVLCWGDRRIPLREGVYLAGRAHDCAIVLDDPTVSRHHARLTVSRSGVTIEDLGSRNGVFVDGVRIDGIQPLPGEHEIFFGKFPASLLRVDTMTTEEVPALTR